MFPLHYTTRRFLCRTAFVLCCLAPTAAVLGWAGWLKTSGHVEACRLEAERTLRLAVKLSTVSHPEPGVSIFEGLELLEPDEYLRLSSDLAAAARAIVVAMKPDRMNYASLGNVVPHVHWHLVPRYREDPRWGSPIYTTDLDDMPRTALSEHEYRDIADRIRAQLDV